MSRTSLHRQIQKLIKIGRLANQQELSDAEVGERLEQGRTLASRRRFLKKAAAFASTALVAGRPEQALAQALNLAESKRSEVLIIGAGAAGLAAAYTLSKKGVPFKVIEANPLGRSGPRFGRIQTVQDFNADGQFCEIGAELVDSNHEVMIGLCAELGLEIETFGPADKDLDPEIFSFGGQIYTHREFVEAIRPMLARFGELMSKVKPSDEFELTAAHRDHATAAAKIQDFESIQALLDAQTDTPLWAREVLRIAYVGEMGLEADEQSSLNLLSMIDTEPEADGFSMFGESDEAHRIKGGNSRLPRALFNKVTKNGLRVADSLSDARATFQYGYSLVKMTASGNKIHCHFLPSGGGSTIKISADQVICTIPFSVLRSVEGVGGLDLSSSKLSSIQELGYGTNSKVMMSFSERVWRRKSGNTPAHAGSMYVDNGAQSFWETSRLQKGDRGILTNFLGGKAGAAANSVDVVGGRVQANSTVQRALNALGGIYQDAVRESFEGRVAVANWSRVPTALGSYSCYKVGQFFRIAGVASKPELNGRLVFAGEHTSDSFQGFMEGGFESGVRAAKEILGSRGLLQKKG